METLPIQLPDTKLIVEETSAAERIAAEIVISTREDYDRADALVGAWRAIEKNIDATFKPIVDSISGSLTLVRQKRDEHKVPIARARGLIDPKMIAFRREEARLEEIERQKREAEARKIAEEARAAEIAEAKKRKDKEAAKQLAAAPLNVPVVSHPPPKPKGSGGTFTRENWSAEVVNFMDLVKAVAKGKAPAECLQPATTFLNAQARALKGNLKIPGVAAKKTESQGVRAPTSGGSWG
jgi:hypothetical protein